ncbi:MAG: acyl-CoA dehydratase activase-related protein [Firmicutes bacterium]|nr:acyl-CoA dehydratase activase-related protein [Bacillota bacterium]
MSKQRIGLPAALMHIYYRSFWKPFFEELGLTVVETGPATKAILNKGIRYSVPEICAPMKIYTGHVVDLLEREVDLVYVPRFISIKKGDTFCPKFLGLPDMLKHLIPHLGPKLLTHHVKGNQDNIAGLNNYLEIGRKFADSDRKVKRAIKAGYEKWLEFRNYCRLEKLNCQAANEKVFKARQISPADLPLKIGVLGYVYNVYDCILSMDILTRLRQLGADSVTFEMLKDNEINRHLHGLRKNLFWTFSKNLMGAAYQFFNDPSIDGIIHVTAFGCGPDAFLGKILELDSVKYEKPLMTIRIDEHSGENHLQTRIEAFVDMIAKAKNYALHASNFRPA